MPLDNVSEYEYQVQDSDMVTNSKEVYVVICDYNNQDNPPYYFDISKKRNFKDLHEKISDAVNYMNYYDPGYYYRVQYSYEAIYDLSIDICDIIEYILNSEAIAYYRQYVDSVYNENIESNRCNPELQFTNEHAKIILVWSFLCLNATPFIAARLNAIAKVSEKSRIDVQDSKFLINKVFVRILGLAEPNRNVTNVIEKIRKMVSSRVFQTKYSDKPMWARLFDLNNDPEITSDNIRRQIIIEGIMKLNCPSNVVKYLHSLIKNQIRYLFRGNFDLDMHPVRSETISGDTFSGTEHLETELSRRNEGNAIILDMILNNTIENMYAKFPFSEETFNIWVSNFSYYGISRLQLSIMTRYLHAKVGNVECIKSMEFVQIIYTLIMIRSWMYDIGLSIIPEIMSSFARDPEEPKKITSRRKFLKEFTSSSAFETLLDRHFKFTKVVVLKSKIIMDDISKIYATDFYRIAEPNLITPNNICYSEIFLYDNYDLTQLSQELLVLNEHLILADRNE